MSMGAPSRPSVAALIHETRRPLLRVTWLEQVFPRVPQPRIDAGNLATEVRTHGPTEADGKRDIPDPEPPIPKYTARPPRLYDGKDDLDGGARSAVAVRHGPSIPCTPANFSGIAIM
jgi:hypothetical protein